MKEQQSMAKNYVRKGFILIIALSVVFLMLQSNLMASASIEGENLAALSALTQTVTPTPEPTQTLVDFQVFLPVISNGYPWLSPFGVEDTSQQLQSNSDIYNALAALNMGWARLNIRVSWRDLQPDSPNDPIDWNKLTNFEAELKALKVIGVRPVVVVDDFPDWALKDVRKDHQLISCGPLKEDAFDDYASFLQQLVNRYSGSDYNVHDWELGNEPDVDPDLLIVKVENPYGCWGDADDSTGNYGGAYYGDMLKVVTPAIKAIDPSAKVWIGGLLLDSPRSENCDPSNGKYDCPENFLRGILASGAGDYFDIVAYHSYLFYNGNRVDHDNNLDNGKWNALGGGMAGKAAFLRDIMADFGVDKPLYMNEGGLLCNEQSAFCDPPGNDFFQMQADYLVRSFVRGLSAGVNGMLWYTINGPGWKHSGLMDENQTPRLSYNAYFVLNQMLKGRKYSTSVVAYGNGIEAYEFVGGPTKLHVLWAVDDTTETITLQKGMYTSVIDEYGTLLTPVSETTTEATFNVGFSPIYVELIP